MVTIVNIAYHIMIIYIVGVLLWAFASERESWEKSMFYLIAVVPLAIRILRIR